MLLSWAGGEQLSASSCLPLGAGRAVPGNLGRLGLVHAVRPVAAPTPPKLARLSSARLGSRRSLATMRPGAALVQPLVGQGRARRRRRMDGLT